MTATIRRRYITDAEQIERTAADMLAYREQGIRVFNAPRPLDSPITDGAWTVLNGPVGFFIALATGSESNVMYGTWERNMLAQDATELVFVANAAEWTAIMRAEMAADGSDEYIDDYLAMGTEGLQSLAQTFYVPRLPEWGWEG